MRELQSENINEIAKAVAEFQGELSILDFDKTAKIKGTSKQNRDYEYSYKYMSLANLRAKTKQLLKEHELAVIQQTSFDNGQFAVVTTLVHSSGQWFRGFYPLGFNPNDPQTTGGGVTYVKRYAMAAILGIVADDDDDGQGANISRQLKQEAAAAKQQEIADKLRREKEMEIAQRKFTIESSLERCRDTTELMDAFSNKHKEDLVWLRSNSKKDFDELVIKKDSLKVQLGVK